MNDREAKVMEQALRNQADVRGPSNLTPEQVEQSDDHYRKMKVISEEEWSLLLLVLEAGQWLTEARKTTNISLDGLLERVMRLRVKLRDRLSEEALTPF